MWHVYCVRTTRNTLYTGIATDVARRYAEHVSAGPRAARYLRSHPPAALVYQVAIGSRALAAHLEAKLKRLNKADKEALIATQPSAAMLLAALRLD